MSDVRGMLTREQLASLVEGGEIETVVTAFPDLYGRLLGKRFDAGFFLEEVADGGTHACDYLLTVDMEMEPVAGYGFASWDQGYGDVHLAPEMQTLRRATWLDRTAIVLCDVHEGTHQPAAIAPRTMLRRQVERVAEAGYTVSAGSELEYYIFRGSYRDAARNGYANLDPAGWYIEDYHTLLTTREEALNAAARRHLRDSGVPVEGSKGEWGIGQHELNIRHAEVQAMADRHAIYKQCLKELAAQMDLSVSFMAKVAEDTAGSGCHLNISLWQDGRNVFAGLGDGADGASGSDLFRWFLGGWIAHAPGMMVFYAPTVNSYKRYRSGSWAPTGLAWAEDNRTTGFRAVGEGDSRRLECRLPGADCNPYLAYAATLASGLDGIANRIEPPPAFDGDAYQADAAARLPATLAEATERFEASEFARSALGEDVVEHYAHFFRVEQEAFEHAVTDWERRRYFERI